MSVLVGGFGKTSITLSFHMPAIPANTYGAFLEDTGFCPLELYSMVV